VVSRDTDSRADFDLGFRRPELIEQKAATQEWPLFLMFDFRSSEMAG
jgi:hypothetical protein